jgi:hypothetical protein
MCQRKIRIINQFFSSNVGLSGAIADNNSWIGHNSNSYALPSGWYVDECWLAGEPHRFEFEFPEGAIRPERKNNGNFFGCGLVLDPDGKLTIFFTLNGQLLGNLILEILRTDKKLHIFPIN